MIDQSSADVEFENRPGSVLKRDASTLRSSKLAGLSVHIFTATGAGFGLLALMAASERRFDLCFAWLGAALLVDGADGALARRLQVRQSTPFIDGSLLDLVVDYLTYVIVPLFAFWRAQAPASWVALACALIATVGSALYFADVRMKTDDHWFRGFPGCWNIAALYYFAFRPPLWIAAAGIVIGTVLMFVPFASAHPLRVGKLRLLTSLFSLLWLSSAGDAIWRGFRPDLFAQAGLTLSAIYFLAMSIAHGGIEEQGSIDRKSTHV